MRLPPLRRATLLRRYKRFLADVRFDDGLEETVHVPNPGAMLGLADPGLTAWVSLGASRTRKLPHTLEFVETAEGARVGVNTLAPNRLAAEALAGDVIPQLAGYPEVRSEVRYGERSRVDFHLGGPGRPPCWLEVKGVTLSRRPGVAQWPDCVSARATRHLSELVARIKAGDRGAVLFIAQRSDCTAFEVAADLDVAFARTFDAARSAGLEAFAYSCEIGPNYISLLKPLKTAW